MVVLGLCMLSCSLHAPCGVVDGPLEVASFSWLRQAYTSMCPSTALIRLFAAAFFAAHLLRGLLALGGRSIPRALVGRVLVSMPASRNLCPSLHLGDTRSVQRAYKSTVRPVAGRVTLLAIPPVTGGYSVAVLA